MDNSFVETLPSGAPDEDLVRCAQSGDREALQQLLTRHQPWIFNIALRMLTRRCDAEDATQEILIRTMNSLDTFRGDSKFSTWLYRIAANHILNMKKGPWTASNALCSFEDAARGLQATPDFDPPDPRTVPIPVELLVEETMTGCITGTLLCLDGRQRLVFTLGILGVSDDVGAGIVDVTPENFRQILSRARRDLREYMQGNCSLINPDASCKCARKTRTFIQAGFVDPNNLQFTSGYRQHVREVAGKRAGDQMDAYLEVAELYRNHPFYEARLPALSDAVKALPSEPAV